jgi:hypothetical protein
VGSLLASVTFNIRARARHARHVVRIRYEKWAWRHPLIDRVVRLGAAPLRLLLRIVPGHNPLFDPEWYVAEYDDVRQMRVSPWNHWKRHGLEERRNPNGLFDTKWYIGRNPEAAEDPLEHYLTIGAPAGVDPSPRFSTTWYLRQYGDVAAAGMNPLVHYLRFGTLERRRPVPPISSRPGSADRGQDGASLVVRSGPVASGSTSVERAAAPWGLVARIEGIDELALLRDVLRDVDEPSSVCISVREDLEHDLDEPVWRQPATIVPELAISSATVVSALSEASGSGAEAVFVILNVPAAVGTVGQGGPARQLLTPGSPRQALHLLRSSREAALLVDACSEDRLSAFWLRTTVGTRRRNVARPARDESDPPQWRLVANELVELSGGKDRIRPYASPRDVAFEGVRMDGKRVKVVAFYLPQFHPIPENDAAWGAGFTEWMQVARARPLYVGHRQPRLPRDLGFYDLRLPETRLAQARLAMEYGVSAFCYYYYWFNGERLLERPLEEVLKSGEPDFPFCICWANENWSRRWDGRESDVIIGQRYADGFARRFINDVIPILRDPRYLRFEGKPVLLVYRVRQIPHVREVIDVWRNECRDAGLGELHLCGVRVPDIVDAHSLGFDAAVDFPPHHIPLRNVTGSLSGLDAGFSGLAYDYEYAVRSNLATMGFGYRKPVHRGVMLAWDNTPRRDTAAHIAQGATPELYQRWLEGVLEQEVRHAPGDESLVFINAWNEWAEGTNLEPDSEFGYGFLNATQAAIEQVARDFGSNDLSSEHGDRADPSEPVGASAGSSSRSVSRRTATGS